MESMTKSYTPPCIEVEEVELECAILQPSNFGTQNLDEEEEYTW